MRYSSGRRRRSRKVTPIVSTTLAVAVLMGLFAYSVYEFRKPISEADRPELVEGLHSMPTSAPATFVFAASDGNQASLHGVAGNTGTGTATRSHEDGVYHLKIKTTLPGIDRVSQFYEGWLVRPIPYAYFALGEMVTNEAGEFVLEFTGDPAGEYGPYTQVVITLESKDGNPDPSGHVLEGEFE